MNNEPQDQTSPEPEASAMPDLSQGFDLVPEWARQPPSTEPFKHAGDVGTRRDRERPARRDREARGGRDASRRPRPRRDNFRGKEHDSGDPNGVRAGTPRERDRIPPRDRPPREEHVPVQISFIPEQEMLTALVADLRASRKAYPLPQVAARFLAHPHGYQVKLEVQKNQEGQRPARLFQCADSGLVFLDRDAAYAQVIQTQLETRFRKEEKIEDPPSGQFVCVAQCSLSGEWLGPPNHHSYNERVDEVHRSRFAHMSADAYRRQIVTLRDPAKIEEWKEQWRRKTVYYRVDAEEESSSMSEREARAWIAEHEAAKQIKEAARFIIPAATAQDTRDPVLLRLMRQAWAREQRFPLTLIRALRGAFRRMGMNVFHKDAQKEFVTAIPFKPLEDTGHVVQNIREALLYIQEHAGCTRQSLIEGCWPDMADDPARAAQALQPLMWLIDKGHIVELYDGTLWVPGPHAAPTSKAEEPRASGSVPS